MIVKFNVNNIIRMKKYMNLFDLTILYWHFKEYYLDENSF
jgi:hypothetical protein